MLADADAVQIPVVQALDLRHGPFQAHGIVGGEADHLAGLGAHQLPSHVGEHVHGVGADDDNGVLEAVLLDLRGDGAQQAHVLLQPLAAVRHGLAGHIGGDEDHAAVAQVLVPGRGDLGPGEGQDGLAHIHGLVLGRVLKEVHQLDLLHCVAHTQHESRGGAQQAGAADNTEFHSRFLLTWPRCTDGQRGDSGCPPPPAGRPAPPRSYEQSASCTW